MTDWNLLTATRTLWQEARGEPLVGQRAVAHVLNNSLKSGAYGNTLAEVCLYHARFSGWWSPRTVNGEPYHDPNFAAACRLPDSDPQLLAMLTLIVNAQTEPDLTGGATMYYAPSIPAPYWVPSMVPCGKFGTQLFFKPRNPLVS